MSTDKSGSPPCGIYLRIDDFDNMQKIIINLRQVAMVINRSSGYEKNMNVVDLVYSFENMQKITDLVMLAQNEGFVAIISGDMPNFDIMGADGVLLDNIDDFNDARDTLGYDVIIGISCGSDKEKAEKAILLEADYITIEFDNNNLVSRLSPQIMCACIGENITNKNCGSLAKVGANFVEVSDYIMNYEKGAMQATVNILHELECAAQMPETLN